MGKRVDQKGFSVVEGLLIVVIIGLISFTGWFVWHSKQNTDKTLNAANKSAQTITPKLNTATITTFAQCKATAGSIVQATSPAKCVTKDGKSFMDTANSTSTQKYVDIKEWGVKFPYTSSDTLSYKFSASGDRAAAIVSANLANNYQGCSAWGAGSIVRGVLADAYSNDETVGQAYQQNPSNFGKIDNYYYYFGHDQAACATPITSASTAAQGAASDLVKSIVPKVVAE